MEPLGDQGQQPGWPAPDGEPLTVLVEAWSPIERQVIDDWVSARHPAATEIDLVPLDASALMPRLRADENPWLAPVRVVWLPEQRNGERTVRIRDLVRNGGDPRHPSAARQGRILREQPDRCRVVVADPARVSELRARWTTSGREDSEVDFAGFVTRQAKLALGRAVSRLEGAQYKVPRHVREEILASARFRTGLARLAKDLDRDVDDVTADATKYLEEMVTGWTRLLIDLSVRLGRYNFRRSYDPKLDLDEAQVARLRAEAGRHPLVFLPSHKSNLDTLVMNVALHDSGLPRTHVFGGINMAFWPMGPIFRRAGTIFIRRDTRGNAVYTFTLREYIVYLIEKRFSLQFYVEGGRSRTGKLLPPRMGLLAYVADAYRQGDSDDVVLVPVSIAYDQLQETSEFAREAKGGSKRAESIGTIVRAFRAQAGRFGRIYVRFGDPVSLRDALGPPTGRPMEGADDRLALQKAAFEVSRRINQVTPITATSLVTLGLLGAQGRALTLEQVRATVHDPLEYAILRGLPITRNVALDTNEGVRGALRELERHDVVARFADGPEAVYAIGPDQHLAAAFYRNTIIHFFLHAALAQMALARISADDPDDPLATFWNTVLATRDLLKFEFFFEPREEFKTAIAAELAIHDLEWQDRVAAGTDSVRQLLGELQPLVAHTVLRSFLESYSVVADALVRSVGSQIDEREFVSQCLALGRQYELQKRIQSPESLSKPLFAEALRLARSRGFVGPGSDADTRRRFLAEVRSAIRDLDVVELMATSRIVELIAAEPPTAARSH